MTESTTYIHHRLTARRGSGERLPMLWRVTIDRGSKLAVAAFSAFGAARSVGRATS